MKDCPECAKLCPECAKLQVRLEMLQRARERQIEVHVQARHKWQAKADECKERIRQLMEENAKLKQDIEKLSVAYHYG